jgi:hypothetical protein
MHSYYIRYLAVLVQFLHIFQLWLKADDTNGHFKRRTTCVLESITVLTR